MAPRTSAAARAYTILACIACIACIAACHPSKVIAGSVRSAPACDEHVVANVDPPPVPFATISVRCPGAAAPVFETAADAGGRVRAEPREPFAFDCEVHVTKAAYAERVYPMREVCSGEDPSVSFPSFRRDPKIKCYQVSLAARLSPAGSQ